VPPIAARYVFASCDMAVCAFGFTFDLLEIGLGTWMSAVGSPFPFQHGARRASLAALRAFFGGDRRCPSWLVCRSPRPKRRWLLPLLCYASVARIGRKSSVWMEC